MARRKKRKSYSAQQKEELLAYQDHRCYYCEEKFKGSGDKMKAPTFEHLQRQADGGSWQGENIVLACKECNSHRDKHTSEEWKAICKDVIRQRKRREFMKNDDFSDLIRYNGEVPRERVKMKLVEVIGK